MTSAGKSSRSKKKRLTIGLMIGRVADIGFAASFWPGIAVVAEERDANLICFIGEVLNMGQRFDAARNVVYDLISPQNVDGLVAMSGSIGQYTGPERLRQFYERFRPLPLVSVGMELEGFPSVLVDNSAGMRDAVAHLIQVHGFRRIAFIRGPETSPEAEERYRAYCEVLEEHGLAFDPDLVAAGDFLSFSGREAVIELLDRRKARFQAIASANDTMAATAITALRERGIRVPEQVSVVGFDNIEDARYVIPPMTTVRQPTYEVGRKAAELLLDLLAGKTVPGKVILPAELIIRRSCGCFSPMAEPAPVENGEGTDAKPPKPSAALRKKILAEMETLATGATAGLDPGWPEGLFLALTKSGKRGASGEDFLLAWEDLLRRVGIKGDDVMQWHKVLAALRRGAPPFRTRGDRSADDRMWRTAELLIGEIAQWAQAHRRFEAGSRLVDFTEKISEPLMTALDVDRLTNIVVSQLPELGLHSCYLSLYDSPDGGTQKAPAEWSRLILACNKKGRIALEPGGRRFPSRDLVPKDILASENRFAMVLEPLYFRDVNQFGFILLGPLRTEISLLREALTRQIGTALKGAALLQERERAEETLRASEQSERAFQERLRTLLEIGNGLSRVESVDELCRQAVELGRSRLGFDRLGIWFHSSDPGIIIGSYGTGIGGKIVDERKIRWPTENLKMEILRQTRPIALFQADAELSDGKGNVVGHGELAQAAMWNGEKVIGFVSLDNLLRHQPISDRDCELLNLYASTLGYLCSRKHAEDSLRAGEEMERQFEERLRTLLEVSNELSRAESVDGLCRQAVELGRSRLGFDRLGIWFHNPDLGIITGSYGTDKDGTLSDERGIHLPTAGLQVDILRQTRPIARLFADVELRDGQGNIIGRGDQAQAAMWNGERVIGFVSADNLLRRQPITDRECELLNLFASTLGYLCSRKQAEEALKDYTGHLQDIVDERTRELQQAQENLVRQEKLAVLGQLAATVSHELRNPLATIRVSATDLDRKVRDRGLGAERPLDRIQRNISRCDNIISELLDYARMPEPNLQTVDFDDWLNRLLDEQTLPPGITLRREISSGATIAIDPERFRRVVINLLDNARQAMQSAASVGAERILTVRSEADADRLTVGIFDTGPGIPPEVMAHLFEPLFSTKGFGVGLGLTVVKMIVEQHGGEILISSRPGEGAQATIRLPRIRREEKRV